MGTFKDRLKKVLHGRPLTGWGQQINLSGGTISRISGGQTPGRRILSLIQKVEGLNYDWILQGRGEPYPVGHFDSDADFHTAINELMIEHWDIFCVTDGQQIVIVMTLPAAIEYNGKMIDYTAQETLTGPIGGAVKEVLQHHGFITLQCTSEQLQQIQKGALGGSCLRQQIINNSALRQGENLCIDEIINHQGIDEFESLIDRYRQLNDRNRVSISLIIDTLLKQQSET